MIKTESLISVSGRIHNIRNAGAKLTFFDIRQGDKKLQVLYNQERAEQDEKTY